MVGFLRVRKHHCHACRFSGDDERAQVLPRKRWPECWANLSSRLGLDDTELDQCKSTADMMATGLDPKTGLFEQFAGYFALEAMHGFVAARLGYSEMALRSLNLGI
jgi:hypothetical protein